MFLLKAPIVEIKNLPGDYARLTFTHWKFSEVCHPGQFLTVRTSMTGTPLLRRPFSIHDVKNDEVSLLFKIIGPGTRQLSEMRQGEWVDVLGPLGHGFHIPTKGQAVWMAAGGIGIAPFLLTVRRLMESGAGPLRLYFGAAADTDLVGTDKLRELGIEIKIATEDGSAGEKGLVTNLLVRDLENTDKANLQLMACGPWPMLKAVHQIAQKAGVHCQVSLETLMACGVGGCMGCAVETNPHHRPDPESHNMDRVCSEGPVFDSNRIEWGGGRHG